MVSKIDMAAIKPPRGAQLNTAVKNKCGRGLLLRSAANSNTTPFTLRGLVTNVQRLNTIGLVVRPAPSLGRDLKMMKDVAGWLMGIPAHCQKCFFGEDEA